jgi:hypothetical protein
MPPRLRPFYILSKIIPRTAVPLLPCAGREARRSSYGSTCARHPSEARLSHGGALSPIAVSYGCSIKAIFLAVPRFALLHAAALRIDDLGCGDKRHRRRFGLLTPEVERISPSDEPIADQKQHRHTRHGCDPIVGT